MTGLFGWVLALLLHPPREAEMSERMAPPGWQGNYWGPQATKARHEGRMPPIVATSHMARWDRWGRNVLRDGDIVFRLGDARLAHGYFKISKFLARASNSKFSHTGIVAIEEEGPVVYDMTRTSVNRQPFCVWVLDNVGSIGVKRVRPEYNRAIPHVLAYCRRIFNEQVPFDYDLQPGDESLYCIEMTEKAYRSAGLKLSDPIHLGDMERASEFPLQMFGLRLASKYISEHPVTFDSPVFFPGNERHGIWSAQQLMTIVPPTFAPGYPDDAESAANARATQSPAKADAEKVSAPAGAQPAAVTQPSRTR